MPKWVRALIVLGLLAVAVGAIDLGLRLRRWAWEITSDVRFAGDISHGYEWGELAAGTGLFNLYDAYDSGRLDADLPRLDYTPLRLAVMMLWARHQPSDDKEWHPEYAFNVFPMWANTGAELLSSILIFGLIRWWRIRQNGPAPFRGVILGILGALLFWFNPAVIWDGHCWPQWDVWLVPFFIAAVWLACMDWWFAAGMCVAVGAFLKGQMLLAAPVLVIWPIFQLRFGAVLRLGCGFALATAAVAFPWLKPNAAGIVWFSMMIVALALLMPWVLRWQWNWKWNVGLAAVSLILAWPWKSQAAWTIRLLPIYGLIVVGLMRFLPRLAPHVYALVLASAVMFTMPLFNASSNWYTHSFESGTEKFEFMMSGTGMYNVPRMTAHYFDMSDDPRDTVWSWHDHDFSFTDLSRYAYAVALLLCGIGAAIQFRRRDTRFLVAMVSPWMLFALILTLMHGRYYVWAAGISSLLAGTDLGLTMLGVLVSMISLIGIMQNQYWFDRDYDPKTLHLLQQFDPGLGWMALVIGLIFLYFTVVPRFRVQPSPSPVVLNGRGLG